MCMHTSPCHCKCMCTVKVSTCRCRVRQRWWPCAHEFNTMTAAGITRGCTAQARVLWPAEGCNSAPVVELRLPGKQRSFAAGQWVFLCVPQLGLLHWHPFTISSGTHDEDLLLHIGANGAWTQRLCAMADQRTDIKVGLCSSCSDMSISL